MSARPEARMSLATLRLRCAVAYRQRLEAALEAGFSEADAEMHAEQARALRERELLTIYTITGNGRAP